MKGVPALDGDYALAAPTIDAYRRDGHVLVHGLAATAEVATYRASIERALDAVAATGDPQQRLDDYGRLFTQVTNLWRMDDAVRAFVLSRRFAGVAARLMGVTGVRLYHDQALFKEPGGEATPWHQDQYYWPLDTPHTVTMWMALVDIPPEMGTMSYASGSHRAEVLPGPISPEENERLEREIAARGFVVGGGDALRAGDATFHCGRTLHSAGPNATARRREVMTVIYFEDGASVLEPANPHQRVDRDVFLPGLAAGQPAASELNPRLYP